jgi:hypothetical protein
MSDLFHINNSYNICFILFIILLPNIVNIGSIQRSFIKLVSLYFNVFQSIIIGVIGIIRYIIFIFPHQSYSIKKVYCNIRLYYFKLPSYIKKIKIIVKSFKKYSYKQTREGITLPLLVAGGRVQYHVTHEILMGKILSSLAL